MLEALTFLTFVLCALVLPPVLMLPIAAVLTGGIAIAEMYRTQRRIYWSVLLTALVCALTFALIGAAAL